MAWPMPTVRHFLACQRFVSDPMVRNISLGGLLYELHPPTGHALPMLQEEIHLLVQLSDGQGEFEFTIELVRMDDELSIAVAPPVRVVLTDRLKVYNFHRRLSRVPFEVPGLYEFRFSVLLVRHPDGSALIGQGPVLLAREPLLVTTQGAP
jgi:hypothetical protein